MKNNIQPYGEVTLGGLVLALIVVFILVALCSCENVKSVEKSKTIRLKYEYIVIDKCEYVWVKEKGAYGQSFVHKGNCKNHKNKYCL